MSNKIADKLDAVVDNEAVRAALQDIFLFEVDQGQGGIQYKKEYRAVLERSRKHGQEAGEE